MSELGDDFKAYNAQRQEKRWNNLNFSTILLEKNNIEYSSYNCGVHLIVENKFDFYPSTGKFINRATKQHGRGVRNLLKLLTGGKDDE